MVGEVGIRRKFQKTVQNWISKVHQVKSEGFRSRYEEDERSGLRLGSMESAPHEC